MSKSKRFSNQESGSAARKSPLILRGAVFFVGGMLAFVAWKGHSQTRILPPEPWPPHPIPPRPIPFPPRLSLGVDLRLISQNARVEIDGGVARTKLEQTFENTAGRTIEGTYVFPLPSGAAVSNFAMTVNGKRVEAEILEGDKAREIYTGIVQKMRDPGILEFIDRNLIRARIFPINAGDRPKVELEYAESLKPESSGANGAFRYVLPLRLPVGGAAQKAVVDVRIRSEQGIRAVYSPTHAIDIKRDDQSARISGEFSADAPQSTLMDGAPRPAKPEGGADRDFVLYYTTSQNRVGLNAVSYRPVGDDGYFMLLAAPDPAISAREIAAKDVVFTFDTSGSMAGEKIEQARRALLNLIGNLNAQDRFNIVTFSSDTRPFRDGLVAASPGNLEAARTWAREIKAVGGTNINDALVESLKMMRDEGRPQQVVFMTDGQPTVGETDIAQILKNVRTSNSLRADPNPFKARLFVFGVGYDVNTRLLDTLAEDNRGSSDYVLPEEDIEAKVGSLYSKIAFPVLSNPQLDWGGLKVYDVYPKRLPDLFKGTQAVVFGRYSGPQSTLKPRLQLTGLANGKAERIEGGGDWSGVRDNDTLPRLWAMRKVGYLVDDARLNNRDVSGEVRDEIIKLSKKYGIVTPYTAALITEDGAVPMQTRENLAAGGGFGGGGFGGATTSSRARRGAFGGAADASAAPPVPSLAAPASGARAVYAAKAGREMRETERVKDDFNARYIEGKAFFLRDGVWTDTAFDAAKSPQPQTIKFGSNESFALLKDKETRVAKWLSIGERVVLVIGTRVVRIEP